MPSAEAGFSASCFGTVVEKAKGRGRTDWTRRRAHASMDMQCKKSDSDAIRLRDTVTISCVKEISQAKELEIESGYWKGWQYDIKEG